jgi:hypothetical protein
MSGTGGDIWNCDFVVQVKVRCGKDVEIYCLSR